MGWIHTERDGEALLTPEIRRELADYRAEELLTNASSRSLARNPLDHGADRLLLVERRHGGSKMKTLATRCGDMAQLRWGRMRAAPLGLLLAIMIFSVGAFLRLYGLDEKGLHGSDTIYYTNIAQAWSEGERVYGIGTSRKGTFRPVTFAAFATALEIFGNHDFAIKTLNAIADSLNILLIYFMGRMLSDRDDWPGLAAACIYAFLPLAIYLSRTELTHTLSTSLVLISFLCFMRYLRASSAPTGLIFLGATGVLTGLAALTHEELIFLSVGYGMTLVSELRPWPGGWRALRGWVLKMGVLGAAIFVMSYQMIGHNLEHTRPAAFDPEVPPASFWSYFEEPLRLMWNAVSGVGSTLVAHLFFLLLGFSLIRPGIRALRPDSLHTPRGYHPLIGIVVLQVTVYSWYFDILFTRLFLPLFPLVLLALTLWGKMLLESRGSERFSRLVMSLLACAVIVFNVGNFSNFREFRTRGYSANWATAGIPVKLDLYEATTEFWARTYEPSWARVLYDHLEGKVDEEARLLVTASLMYPYPGRRTLQVDYYFGDNAIFAIDHQEPLEELISKYRIRYVLLSTRRADRRFLTRERYERYLYNGRWGEPELLRLGASYGFEEGEYSLEKEFHFLREFLERRNARIVFASGLHAFAERQPITFLLHDANSVVYELPPRPW